MDRDIRKHCCFLLEMQIRNLRLVLQSKSLRIIWIRIEDLVVLLIVVEGAMVVTNIRCDVVVTIVATGVVVDGSL